MTGEAVGPSDVVIAFPADGKGDPSVRIGAAVTVGQVALAAWLLDRVAVEARSGQLLAQHVQAQQAQVLAAGLRNGGRG